MKGFWKMLTGQGEAEYREQHRIFKSAIPDFFPAGMSIEEKCANHPAYSGPLAASLDAANYRRAHNARGPQSKSEHAEFDEYQSTHDQFGRSFEEQ